MPPQRNPSTPRDSYAAVGQAMRQSIERAARAKLGARDHRVHAAVLALTASWSKLADETSLKQIASIAFAIEPDDVEGWHRTKVAVSLKRLSELGIVAYAAGRGPGARCRVEIESTTRNGWSFDPGERPPAAGCDSTERPPVVAHTTTRSGSERPPAVVTTPRSSPRTSPEGEIEISRDALADRACAHFACHGISRDDIVRAVDQLRADDIGDTVIDEALGQCEAAGARSLGYLVKVARDWMAQRTGYPLVGGLPVVMNG